MSQMSSRSLAKILVTFPDMPVLVQTEDGPRPVGWVTEAKVGPEESSALLIVDSAHYRFRLEKVDQKVDQAE